MMKTIPSTHSIKTTNQAFAFCENLARTHYENFTVGSILLPKETRPHIYNLYAYCRLSDDIGDEIGDPQKSLEIFGSWRKELLSCYDGSPTHPVFIALQQSIRKYNLPIEPFQKLIKAFEMDQTIHRYDTFEKLTNYCEHSANPVGRLFLNIFGYQDEERRKLSDYTCTALQLANFWQDIPIDYQKGRIYIPLEDMERFRYTESELSQKIYNDAFIQLMQHEINRADDFFQKGLPLAKSLTGKIRIDVECFSRGGMKILDKIRKINYNVLNHRPTISKWNKAWLLMKVALKQIIPLG